MTADIGAEIEQLRKFSRQQLLDKWRELYRRPAPLGIRRTLLVPFLAYRLQEITFGGLKPSTRAELRRIAQALNAGTGFATSNLQIRTPPGTTIVRHWKGKAHEVLVTESGFEYGGSSYDSLSPIARRITGTRWSGPVFFGLKKGGAGRGGPNE